MSDSFELLFAANKITGSQPAATFAETTVRFHGFNWMKSGTGIDTARTNIAGVAILPDNETPNVIDSGRDLRVLRLQIGTGAPAVAWFFFREPVLATGFKLGVDRALAISAKERRNGVLVDVLGIDVSHPDITSTQLTERCGLAPTTNIDRLVTSTYGFATAERVAERTRKGTTAKFAVSAYLTLFPLILVSALTAKESLRRCNCVDASSIVRNVVAAAIAIALGFAAGRSTIGRKAFESPTARALRPLVGIVLPLVLLIIGALTLRPAGVIDWASLCVGIGVGIALGFAALSGMFPARQQVS
jgi:hypothetical protein